MLTFSIECKIAISLHYLPQSTSLVRRPGCYRTSGSKHGMITSSLTCASFTITLVLVRTWLWCRMLVLCIGACEKGGLSLSMVPVEKSWTSPALYLVSVRCALLISCCYYHA